MNEKSLSSMHDAYRRLIIRMNVRRTICTSISLIISTKNSKINIHQCFTFMPNQNLDFSISVFSERNILQLASSYTAELHYYLHSFTNLRYISSLLTCQDPFQLRGVKFVDARYNIVFSFALTLPFSSTNL